jgi:hypothetical protein
VLEVQRGALQGDEGQRPTEGEDNGSSALVSLGLELIYVR